VRVLGEVVPQQLRRLGGQRHTPVALLGLQRAVLDYRIVGPCALLDSQHTWLRRSILVQRRVRQFDVRDSEPAEFRRTQARPGRDMNQDVIGPRRRLH